jgi:hypothetical protein
MGRRIFCIFDSKIVSALALSVASALAVSSAPREAEACSCRPPPPPERALEAAEAVFEARVSSPPTTKSGASGIASSADEKRVPLKILRAWKGAGVEVGRDVTLLTPSGSASCGYGFKEGESYVIYAARTQSGDLTTNICTRTRRSQDAAEDVAALDAAIKAGGGATPPPTGTSNTGGSGVPTPGGAAGETPPGGGSAPPTTGGEVGSPAPAGGAASPPGSPSAAPPGGGCAGCATAPSGESAGAFFIPVFGLGLAAGICRARRAQKARGARRAAP